METNTALSTAAWKQRELSRFADGTYKPLPVVLDYPRDHFVHLSTTETEADYVAYTPSETYGEADRQVRLKFGRYLRKTFQDMADDEIQKLVTKLKADTVRPVLHFATDKETINRVFETEMRSCSSSCTSCMWGKFDGDTRPYHVYADSPDVAVAYATVNDRIVSRSVVSTKDKQWVRTYAIADGDNDAHTESLKDLLVRAGYKEGDLIGNRLTKLNTRKVMLPYIDHSGANVEDSGKYWRVVEDGGDWTADCTDGTASRVGPVCSVCDEPYDDCECSYCSCCDERYRDGCDRCNMCERCDSCVPHGGCSCERCPSCRELIVHRYGTSCECERCDTCHELTRDCECEPEEEEDARYRQPLVQAEIKEKLNRIWMYLVNAGSNTEEIRSILLAAWSRAEVNTEEIAA